MPFPGFPRHRTTPASATRLRLSDSAEGRMLRLGLILSALMLAAFGIGWHFFPDLTFVFAAMTGLNLLIGRAAGMSFGYASDLGHMEVVPVNMFVESIQVLVIYPLVVLSLQNLLDLPRLRPLIARMQGTAEARRGAVSKFGIAGLFVFVFIPFWMTGPVVGALIGFLIGLRPWVNLAVVLSATFVAIGFWALLLNEYNTWASTYHRFAPFALVIAIVLIALGGRLLQWRRRNGGPRRGLLLLGAGRTGRARRRHHRRRRRGNDFLRLLRFLRFPIASQLTLGHGGSPQEMLPAKSGRHPVYDSRNVPWFARNQADDPVYGDSAKKEREFARIGARAPADGLPGVQPINAVQRPDTSARRCSDSAPRSSARATASSDRVGGWPAPGSTQSLTAACRLRRKASSPA
jgi:uncharacterized membrane protein